MNSILISSVFFASIFAAALLGMAIRRSLPEEHVGSDAKEIVRLATGLIATMAALVLGMLVSSAKSYYDSSKHDIEEVSSEIVSIDHLLARFGPQSDEIRAEFRQLVELGLDRIWPNAASQHADLRPGDHGQILIDKLVALVPQNEMQAAAKTQAISMINSLRQAQWRLFLRSQQKPIPLPLLAVLISWLAAIFASFGLFAPSNATVVATLALSALAVSSAIFIILEMYTPFGGIMTISQVPMLEALKQMGH